MPQPKVWIVELHPDGHAHAYQDKLNYESESDSLSSEGHFRTDVRATTRPKAIAEARARLAAHYAELATQRFVGMPVYERRVEDGAYVTERVTPPPAADPGAPGS